jgi:hypothetical protein
MFGAPLIPRTVPSISDLIIYEKARIVVINPIIPRKKRTGFKIKAEIKNDRSEIFILGNIEIVKKPLINAKMKMKNLMIIKIPPIINYVTGRKMMFKSGIGHSSYSIK